MDDMAPEKTTPSSPSSSAAASFARKVALVTGAGSGIGRASALHLARRGARVALLSRDAEELQEVCEEISALGAECLVITGDVSSPEHVEGAMRRIEREWSQLDYVVANAGINGLWAPLEKISPDDWDQTLNINLRGTFLTVKYALPLLKIAGGAVVIVSSVNGNRMFSNTGASAYATSKAGQVAFARMIALELARFRIRVNTVCPGAIETKIDDNTQREDLGKIRTPVEFPEGSIPLTHGAAGRAEQVARVIGFLLSDAADHVTGTEIYVDGGESLLEG